MDCFNTEYNSSTMLIHAINKADSENMEYRIIPVTSYQQNCSLIWCQQSKQAALIDPGGDIDKLLQAVDEEGVTLVKLLLTHGHLDHVGATLQLSQQLNIPIIGPHKADHFWLDALPQQAQMFGFDPAQSFVPHQWLEEGEKIDLGEEELEALHCPGHTPGHVVFFHRQEQLLFVGDVLFQGSIGRTDFPMGDHQTLIHAIQNKLLPLGGDVTFVPGHGPCSTLGHEQRFNPFLNE